VGDVCHRFVEESFGDGFGYHVIMFLSRIEHFMESKNVSLTPVVEPQMFNYNILVIM